MKVGRISLEDLMRLLGGDTTVLDSIDTPVDAAQKRHADFMAAYSKKVANATSVALTEFLNAASQNSCDHYEHRKVPSGRNDWDAVMNFVRWIAQLHISASKDAAVGSYQVGLRVAEGEALPVVTHAVEALNIVSALALDVATAMLCERESHTVPTAQDFMPVFKVRMQTRAMDIIERMVSGNTAPRRAPTDKEDHGHGQVCH